LAVKPIALSFKDNKEDMELYEWIISHSNKSGFIKDTLRLVKESEVDKKNIKKEESVRSDLIDINF